MDFLEISSPSSPDNLATEVNLFNYQSELESFQKVQQITPLELKSYLTDPLVEVSVANSELSLFSNKQLLDTQSLSNRSITEDLLTGGETENTFIVGQFDRDNILINSSHLENFVQFKNINSIQSVALESAENLSLEATSNNFSQNSILPELDPSLLSSGTQSFLNILQGNLEENVLERIPIIGSNIQFDPIDSFIQKLRTAFEQLNDPNIFNNPPDLVIQGIQEILSGVLGDILQNGVTVNIVQDGGSISELTIDLHLAGVSSLTSNFELERQGNTFEITAQGGVQIDLGYDFRFKVGINRTERFFFELPDGTDFNFNLDVSLDDSALSGRYSLFQAQLNTEVFDERARNKDYNQDGDLNDSFTTGLGGALSVDIFNSGGDNRITLDELNQIELDVDFQTAVAVALHLNLGTISRDLPSIETDLFASWQFTLQNSTEVIDNSAILSLNDISLNVGAFVTEVVHPVLKEWDSKVEPIRPYIEFLEKEVPIVSDLYEAIGRGSYTVLDAVEDFGQRTDTLSIDADEVREWFRLFHLLDDYLRRLNEFTSNSTLDFGDLIFNSNGTTTFIPDRGVEQIDVLVDIARDLNIRFPIFDNPNVIADVLLGRRVDIITWALPKVDLRLTIGLEIPIFFTPYGNVELTVSGNIDKLSFNLSGGFDTTGLLTGKFLDGIYLNDRDSTGNDIPEAEISGSIAVGLQYDFAVLEVGVEGGIQLNAIANLNDSNSDGKVYLNEFLASASHHWMCNFGISGEIGAFLDAYVRIDAGSNELEYRKTLYYDPILDLSDKCETDPPQSPGEQPTLPSDLGHYSTGIGEDAGIKPGTLIVHTGRFAHLRQPGLSTDAAEQLYITRFRSGVVQVHSGFRRDYRQRLVDPHPTGTIEIFGDDANELPVTDIYIDAGEGDDYIEIDDFVTANVTILGGVGDDTIKAGRDTTAYVEGGTDDDIIDTGRNNDTVIGGLSNPTTGQSDGKDIITDIRGDDILIGDHGRIVYDPQGVITLIESLEPASGDDDVINTYGGNDTVIGGARNDYINNGGDATNLDGADIVFGDSGRVQQDASAIIRLASIIASNGGNDTIAASIGKDTVMGGAANDIITNEGDTSPDVIYGDQGYWDAETISASTDADDGDDQLYSEGGNDIILAGGAKDYVESGNNLDIIFGDHGIVTRNAGVVIRIETTESDSGDNDTIFAGNDDDTVFGGPKNDRITGDTTNNGDDILVGDQGYWNPTLIVSQFDATSNPDGNDTIYGNGGNDTVLGSDGKDYIEGNQGFDIALGDYGTIIHEEKITLRIDTTVKDVDGGNLDKGNDDFIHGGDQNDTLIGGTQNDSLFGGVDAGEDILIGDNGTVVNDDGSPESNDIFSHTPTYGGLDRIAGGAGNDTIIGGSGGKDRTNPQATVLTGKSGDGIDGNEGNDLAIGDNAYITRNSNEKNEKIVITFTSYGGDDYLLGSAGNDSLIAGYGKDSVSGNDGSDLIFGDNAVFDYLIDNNPDTLERIITTDVTLGDKDTLTGDGGNDLIFGGTKEDSIFGGSENDLLIGDHGKAEGNINLSVLPLNQTTPPFTFTAINTQKTDLGGNDIIRGDDGDDIILGQQGNDRLFGDNGDDDIIGGHNVADGYDGNDEIDGGTGNDAIAGDNAAIQRRADTLSTRIRRLISQVIYDDNGNPQVTADSQPHPSGVAGRNIQLFNHSTTAKTGTYGKDTIAGGANEDLIFGQLGDDIIQGDSSTTRKVSLTTSSVGRSDDGDDYIEGGGGKDLIFGNLGQDDIIGGSSNLFGTNTTSDPQADLPSAARPDAQDTIFGGANLTTNTEDRAHDADVILGDNGNIFRLVDHLGRYLSTSGIITRAFQLLDYTPGSNTGNVGSDDLIHGEAGNDEIHGMTGNDSIFGEGQDDTLYGGVGQDSISGDTGENRIIEDDIVRENQVP